jgi:hypothetical protein
MRALSAKNVTSAATKMRSTGRARIAANAMTFPHDHAARP